MQVNIGSPAGNLGPEVKQCAERLLMLECVSFLATDAHDSRYRSTELIDIYNRLCGKFPNIDLFSLLEDNPNALMSNKIIRTKYYRQ
jgi:tyrosine-protein phosphatase YwqE